MCGRIWKTRPEPELFLWDLWMIPGHTTVPLSQTKSPWQLPHKGSEPSNQPGIVTVTIFLGIL